jgi:hypothetical protein
MTGWDPDNAWWQSDKERLKRRKSIQTNEKVTQAEHSPPDIAAFERWMGIPQTESIQFEISGIVEMQSTSFCTQTMIFGVKPFQNQPMKLWKRYRGV